MSGGATEIPPAAGGAEAGEGMLAEARALSWRKRLDDAFLHRVERRWTAWNVAISAPFFLTAVFLLWLEPLLAPVALWSVAHGVAIPALYARRGARSVVPLGGRGSAVGSGDRGAERVALGLLGDLVGHEARELAVRTGLVLEPGRLGTWLLGERGAILIRPGGRRADCWCVRIGDPDGLPAADRISHLLLALREDEYGFATVANMDFSGSPRRLRRRLEPRSRPALDAAVAAARSAQTARRSVEPVEPVEAMRSG